MTVRYADTEIPRHSHVTFNAFVKEAFPSRGERGGKDFLRFDFIRLWAVCSKIPSFPVPLGVDSRPSATLPKVLRTPFRILLCDATHHQI